MQLVIRTDELKVLDRRYCYPPVEIEAIIAIRERGLSSPERKHVAIAPLPDERQLQGMRAPGGEQEKDCRCGRATENTHTVGVRGRVLTAFWIRPLISRTCKAREK